ncbi:MAG TPA: hypothetical protein VI732_01950 [Alphaproteobacteria bacterium]|nr:hypothetical protein [Alphaproteobacteria bacterium]
MIGARELTSSIYGAFRLAALHGDGMEFFNRTPEGFWRSFFAAALVAPGYIAISLLDPDPAAFTSVHDAAVNGLAYVIGWVAFPIAVVPLVRMLDRGDRYIGYIVAYNWAAVPQMLLFAAAGIASRAMSLGPGGVEFLGIMAVVAVIFYYWFIARTALGVDGFAAAGVVVLDLALTMIISAVTGALTGAPIGAVIGQ